MKKTFLLAYIILGLTIASIAQIDAAVKVGDSLYFFKGANCVTYSLITKTVRIKPISTVWPSLAFSSDISSAFMLKDKLIFTKGTTYVEWDIQKKRGDIPQVINSGNFGFSSLDAAFEFPNSDNGGEGIEGKVYFFKSSVYSRSDLYDGVLDQTNKANSGWTGLGWSTIDAALTDDKNRVYFFKGDELAIVNVASQTVVSKSKIKVIFQLPSSWFTSTPSPPVSTTPPTTSTSVSSGSEITIGTQTWKTKNLDVKYYRDGTEIEHVTSNSRWTTTTTGAWCYYDNDPSKGVLYNWYAVSDPRGLAPAGWHVPTVEDWEKLFSHSGGKNFAGGKLKESGTSNWKAPNYGTDSYGFKAVPDGYRHTTSEFFGLKSLCYFWSSTPKSSTDATVYRITTSDIDTVRNYNNPKNRGYSVRLIKDKVSSNGADITTNISVVKIGSQTWMAKDLNVKNYRNGTAIPQVSDPAAWARLTSGAWCYYDNANPSKGILYNWYAVNDSRGLAPVDWYIPTKEELATLNGNGINIINSQFIPGKGGFRSSTDGREFNNGLVSYYWSATFKSTTNSNSAGGLGIDNSTGIIKPGEYNWKNGLSVRCIQRVVEIKEAVTGWPKDKKDQVIQTFTSGLEGAGYPESQSRTLSLCIAKELEIKYPDIDALNSKSPADIKQIGADAGNICGAKYNFPDPTVTFGSQTWMTNDLTVKKYRNGEAITYAPRDEWTNMTIGAWCYFEGDPNKGVLYNWYAVNDPRGLAPYGWHVPSKEEWDQLGNDPNFQNQGFPRILENGHRLNGWDITASRSAYSYMKNGGAYYKYDGMTIYGKQRGTWWSSTQATSFSSYCFSLFENNPDAPGIRFWGRTKPDPRVNAVGAGKSIYEGYRVRCVKD